MAAAKASQHLLPAILECRDLMPRTSRRMLLRAVPAAAVITGLGAEENDQERIAALIAKYAASIDAADTKLAAEIWSASPEVSFIHPLGEERGLAEVKQHVYTRIMGGMFSERKLQPHDPVIHVYGDTAWSWFTWDFKARLAANGAEVHTSGRETQIYRKEPSGWRLVHVHYSAVMQPPQAG